MTFSDSSFPNNSSSLNTSSQNSQKTEAEDFCIVIPTYNNGATVAGVVARAHRVARYVIVVDDGSTDDTAARFAAARGAACPDCLLRHSRNRGKGAALRTGLRHARALRYRYAVTIDADGQHDPADVPALLAPLTEHPDALVVGSRCMVQANKPGKNTFANRFSNFWFALQTLRRLPDTQSGLRVYPLRRIGSMRFLTARYEAELELLVFAAWRGVRLIPAGVTVTYGPDRVTHFRPLRDFGRISILNTVLCFLAVVYGYPRMLLSRIF